MTSHGDRCEVIFEDDDDRLRFLEILGMVAADYSWLCHGYGLMGSRYHLIIETLDGNLPKEMRTYTQAAKAADCKTSVRDRNAIQRLQNHDHCHLQNRCTHSQREIGEYYRRLELFFV